MDIKKLIKIRKRVVKMSHEEKVKLKDLYLNSLNKWEESEKPDWMYVDLIQWVCEDDMTDKEKESNPTYVTTGGYLKFYSSLQHAYIEKWDKASKEDRELTFKLPNFDMEVFKEIFGFTPTLEDIVDR